MVRLELRDPDTTDGTAIVTHYHPANGVALFHGLADACVYVNQWFPGYWLRMEPNAWYVVVGDADVARLVDPT